MVHQIVNPHEFVVGSFVFNSKKDFYVFIFVVIAVALVPICGYYITRDMLIMNTHIQINKIMQISGAVAVFLLNLIIFIYIYLVVTDKNNFNYEQQQIQVKKKQ